MTARPIRFLAGSALALALAAPAFAQSGTQSDTSQTTEPPAAVEQNGDTMQAPGNGGIESGAEGGMSMDSDAPTLKNTLTDEMTAPPGQDDPTAAARAPAGAPVGADGLPAGPILTAQKTGQVASDTFIGMDVRNPEDESIGTLDALVIDRRNRVVAGIVSVGGFLGIGAKDVAVNWREFDFQPEQEVAVVMLSREQLENAPAFRDRGDLQARLRAIGNGDSETRTDRLNAEPGTPVDKPSAAE
ncbi:PRC-barrel domain-containing protein [Microbaculum marinisediminis]|uniref:PRC-barrel domain-containing protein n=1 Tax=Microbaculum marinisediminis TaxID=2931392 RepID=A0AAW5QXY3_9HYPH|nr:PRC-barrel domain-containing protein [Microbaculum sp. A6E488]MCT8971209.1 PRC-barrel domain-containing protein [Microbaculum sp. A6E488]